VARRAHVDALRPREVELEGQVVEDDLLDLEHRSDEVEARRVADLVRDHDGLVLRASWSMRFRRRSWSRVPAASAFSASLTDARSPAVLDCAAL
jgi:hypothetical protein